MTKSASRRGACKAVGTLSSARLRLGGECRRARAPKRPRRLAARAGAAAAVAAACGSNGQEASARSSAVHAPSSPAAPSTGSRIGTQGVGSEHITAYVWVKKATTGSTARDVRLACATLPRPARPPPKPGKEARGQLHAHHGKCSAQCSTPNATHSRSKHGASSGARCMRRRWGKQRRSLAPSPAPLRWARAKGLTQQLGALLNESVPARTSP